MVKSKGLFVLTILSLLLTNCKRSEETGSFDQLNETVRLGNWEFAIKVENLQDKHHKTVSGSGDHYLKATLNLRNKGTNKSLLYSVSQNSQDYEAKYQYLSFGSKNDLYLKYQDNYIYPIGYVFEPSNGLSPGDRLVYKFQLSDKMFQDILNHQEDVAYWYIDRMAGLGKICFKPH